MNKKPKNPIKKTSPKKTSAKKPLAKKPVSTPAIPNITKTMSVRKISNGYVITKDSYNRKTGKYKTTEVFAPKKPKLDIKK